MFRKGPELLRGDLALKSFSIDRLRIPYEGVPGDHVKNSSDPLELTHALGSGVITKHILDRLLIPPLTRN